MIFTHWSWTGKGPDHEQLVDCMYLVGNHATGAPVIFEDMPTYQKLHGRIEHIARMGMLSTHFTLIKPGVLHQANGGYLILDARRLLMQPYAYEGLKRSLRSRQIIIEPLDRLLGLVSTVTLEPEPIPLNVKIVLICDTLLYYLLKHYDPEFHSFFKVQADFEQSMDRSPENINLFTSLLATMIAREKLLPMNRKAVAGLIEYSARAAGDGTKLSLAVEDLADVMKEADYIARQLDKTLTEAEDVTAALAARKRRGGRIRDNLFEATRRGLRHIETAGERVGLVNGLSVTTVDEAISLLTSLPAGERGDDGEYPEESVNGRVEMTLRSFAVTIQMFEKKEFKEE